MNVNESANLPANGGSKTVEPSTELDNSDDYSFWEPEDDEVSDNPEGEGDETGSETGEAEEGQETGEENVDETGGEAGEGEEEQSENAKLDETLVTLKGGEKVPVKELKLGYMRLNDYRMKTQETANKGRALEDMSNRVVTTATAIAEFLISQMPPEPSAALAMQNPGEFTRQKAMFDAAAQRVNQILAMANEPKQVVGNLTKEQRATILHEESTKLAEAFPQTANPEGREAFFQEAFETARELGFTDEEMQGTTDHRMFKLAHYARLGLQAEQAKKKAMAKVNNAPPPAVRGRAQGSNAQQVRKQKDAMARLDKTGSLQDALKVDWE